MTYTVSSGTLNSTIPYHTYSNFVTHQSIKVIESGTIRYTGYGFIVTLSPRCTISEIFDFKNAMTLKTGLGLRQGHWKYHHVIEHL